MAKKSKKKSTKKKTTAKKKVAAKPAKDNPVTLAEALALVRKKPKVRKGVRRSAKKKVATPEAIGIARETYNKDRTKENSKRIKEFKAVMKIMKRRGVKGLLDSPKHTKKGKKKRPTKRRRPGASTAGGPPLQIFAEGDSWFDYPPFFIKGGLIPRLQKRLGVPILNLAKAGDEVRNLSLIHI